MHLFAVVCQFWVSSNASLHIVMALSMATEIDRVGVYVDVHEVVDNLALDVVLHLVDQESTTNIDDLDEWQVPVGQREMRADI